MHTNYELEEIDGRWRVTFKHRSFCREYESKATAEFIITADQRLVEAERLAQHASSKGTNPDAQALASELRALIDQMRQLRIDDATLREFERVAMQLDPT
jgi:hypothetical protein